MTLDQLCEGLRTVPARYTSEADLQVAIDAQLVALDFVRAPVGECLGREPRAFAREATLPGLRDRPDFVAVLPGCMVVAIEVKVAGPLASVTRQLHRYAGRPELDAVVLVTTRNTHRRLPATLQGKRLELVYLSPLGQL